MQRYILRQFRLVVLFFSQTCLLYLCFEIFTEDERFSNGTAVIYIYIYMFSVFNYQITATLYLYKRIAGV